MLISIVTATYNSARDLPALIESLRGQTDTNFEWVVADGASTDGTVELVRAASDLRVIVSSQPDFGIYDALNRALRMTSGSHYVVVGSDDRLDPDAVANYRRVISQTDADVIAARVRFGSRCFKVRRGPAWLHGARVYISNHSLATAIRTNLHERFGYYSRRFPIGADALFVLQVCGAGVKRVEVDFIVGEMGQHGVSAVDWACSATDVFRVQLALGRSFYVQWLLLQMRLLKGNHAWLGGLLTTLRRLW